MPDAADEFLAQVKRDDPERYSIVAARHPLISKRSRRRDRRMKLYEPTDPRGPLSDEARQRYLDQRELRQDWLIEHRLDYALAKELADQGM